MAEQSNKQTTPLGQATPTTPPEQTGGTSALSKALQGAALQPVPSAGSPTAGGGYSIERGSPGILDWLLDSAAARKHREVMTLIRDTGIETMEAMNVSSMLTADFVANSLDC
ncbi:MAG: hypothetical protein HXX20_07870 [Chloroflexi bacterium]|nr:hypothetical protein [Chloroflexota bacterium]